MEHTHDCAKCKSAGNCNQEIFRKAYGKIEDSDKELSEAIAAGERIATIAKDEIPSIGALGALIMVFLNGFVACRDGLSRYIKILDETVKPGFVPMEEVGDMTLDKFTSIFAEFRLSAELARDMYEGVPDSANMTAERIRDTVQKVLPFLQIKEAMMAAKHDEIR